MTPMECERIERESQEAVSIGPGGWLAAGVAALAVLAFIAEARVFW